MNFHHLRSRLPVLKPKPYQVLNCIKKLFAFYIYFFIKYAKRLPLPSYPSTHET
jgi:hypothetical protein